MSVRAMADAFEHSPYKGDALVVHLAIADVVNDLHDNQLWMTAAALAEKARCSEATVRRVRAQMLADGILVHVERAGGRGKPAVFQYVSRDKPAHSERLSEEKPAQPATETRSTAQSSLSLNASELKSERESFVSDFDALWRVYPKRKNNPRKGALRSYQARRRDGVPADALLTATRNYAASRDREDPAYTLMAQTFLGPNERWKEWLDRAAEPQREPTVRELQSGRWRR